MGSCEGISLSALKDLYVSLVNERRKNHDSFWSIHDGHDRKTKDRCYETKREYKSAESEEMEPVLFIEMDQSVKTSFEKSYDIHF